MGTINYGTSNYITMGIKPYYYTDFDEKEIAEDYCMANDCDIDDFDVAPYIMDLIQDYYMDDWRNCYDVLSQYFFHYYHVVLKGGYYEGFYLDIENNYGVCYDDWTDRREANKEITQLKECLIKLAGMGMVACYPFWVMSYEDYEGTLRCIDEAIKEMRAEVKVIPTWRQYEREAK